MQLLSGIAEAMNNFIIRTYTELSALPTMEERFNYLRVNSQVGFDKFGYDRYFNQQFYHSPEWRRIRDIVIYRDQGCELGLYGFPIVGPIYIHHMNPVTIEDLTSHNLEKILQPEFLVCCSLEMHLSIHYGELRNTFKDPIERRPNDTCPWKR